MATPSGSPGIPVSSTEHAALMADQPSGVGLTAAETAEGALFYQAMASPLAAGPSSAVRDAAHTSSPRTRVLRHSTPSSSPVKMGTLSPAPAKGARDTGVAETKGTEPARSLPAVAGAATEVSVGMADPLEAADTSAPASSSSAGLLAKPILPPARATPLERQLWSRLSREEQIRFASAEAQQESLAHARKSAAAADAEQHRLDRAAKSAEFNSQQQRLQRQAQAFETAREAAGAHILAEKEKLTILSLKQRDLDRENRAVEAAAAASNEAIARQLAALEHDRPEEAKIHALQKATKATYEDWLHDRVTAIIGVPPLLADPSASSGASSQRRPAATAPRAQLPLAPAPASPARAVLPARGTSWATAAGSPASYADDSALVFQPSDCAFAKAPLQIIAEHPQYSFASKHQQAVMDSAALVACTMAPASTVEQAVQAVIAGPAGAKLPVAHMLGQLRAAHSKAVPPFTWPGCKPFARAKPAAQAEHPVSDGFVLPARMAKKSKQPQNDRSSGRGQGYSSGSSSHAHQQGSRGGSRGRGRPPSTSSGSGSGSERHTKNSRVHRGYRSVNQVDPPSTSGYHPRAGQHADHRSADG